MKMYFGDVKKIIHQQVNILSILLFSVLQCGFFLSINPSPKYIIISSFCTFIFYILLRSIHKYLFNVAVVISFFLSCCIYPALQISGDINKDYLQSVFYTNAQESISYFKIVPLEIFIFLLLFGIVSLYIIRIPENTRIPHLGKIILLCFLFIFPFDDGIQKSEDIIKYLPIIKYPVTSAISYQEIKQEDTRIRQELAKTSKKTSLKIDQNKQMTFVIVIGESVRRDFLHSYGFPIKNTPFIENSPNVQFENYISSAATTFSSLHRTIAYTNDKLEYQLGKNIITLFQEIWYKTYWISNQGKTSKVDTPITLIGQKADKTHFLNKGSFRTVKANSDGNMIPYYEKILGENEKHKLIILHMIGSHPSACDKTGGEYDEFIVSKEISCYNKTIKNLDDFLKKVYEPLRNSNQNFYMIYVSDHGLAISKNKNMTHKHRFRQNYQVPLILWWSNLQESAKIYARRTGKDFLHFVNELMSKQMDGLPKRNYAFLSEENNDDDVTKIYSWGQIRNYEDYTRDDPVGKLFEEEKQRLEK